MKLLIFCAATIALSVLIYWRLAPFRRSRFLLVLSLAFAAFFSVTHMLYFLAQTFFIYWLGQGPLRRSPHKKKVLQGLLIWLVGNLCFFKYIHGMLRWAGGFMPALGQVAADLPPILLPVGLSYLTFRLVHYAVEVYRDRMPCSGFVDFAAYTLFFPTFLAGPLERFPVFHKQTVAIKTFDAKDINTGLIRILTGIFKKAVVADTLGSYAMPILNTPEEASAWVLMAALYAMTFQIYMDFAGYTDMAIGVARLFGYRILENFNWPFFKKNIAEFWRNWHISMYTWRRDYFFFPFFAHRPSTLKLYAGTFITMMVFMLWHRGTAGFFFLGLYHGSGIVLWQIFQKVKTQNTFLKQIFSAKILTVPSVMLTVHFVAMGTAFFGFDPQHSFAILAGIYG